MTVNLPSTKIRKNFCSNPSFEIDNSGWTYAFGGATIARSTVRAHSAGGYALASGLVTWATVVAGFQAVGLVTPILTTADYTFSIYVYVPTGQPRVFIDVDGAFVGPTSTVHDAWQRLSVALLGNSTTHTIRVLNADNATAGQFCYVDDAMVEIGDPPAGDYFDGDTANGWWDGANGKSTSEQIVPAGLNPNLPLMGWRVWNLEDPPPTPFFPVNNGVGPTTVPLCLSDRATHMTIDRGRQYELDQDATGIANVTLKNNDGKIIGGPANSMYPCRLGEFRVTYLGVNYVLYTGYVSDWPDKATDPASSEAVLTFMDLMDPLANYPLYSLVREATINLAHPPNLYYPLSDGAGSLGAGNIIAGTAYPTAPLVDAKFGGTGNMTFGGSAFVLNGSETTLQSRNFTGPTGKATQVQIAGPTMTAGPTIDTTQPWAAMVFLEATAGKSAVFSMFDSNVAFFADIEYDTTGSGGTGTVTVTAGGGGFTWGGMNAYLKQTPGAQVVVGYDGTHGFGFIIGGNKQTWTYTPKGISRWISAGMCFNDKVIYVGSNADFNLAHLALWTNGQPLPADADWFTVHNAGFYAFSGDTAEVRINRVQHWAGQGGTFGEFSGTVLGAMQDTLGAAALDVMRTAALSVDSRLTIGADGTVTTWWRNHGQDFDPKAVFGSNTGAGELPYTGAPSFAYDPTRVFNDVQVSRIGGAVQRWTVASSIARYFTRRLQISTNLNADVDAQYRAQWYANRYSTPDYRIGDIVLDPVANPALWPTVLGLVLSDVVKVNHRDVNGTRSGLFQVAKIKHEVDAPSGTWLTTLSLTPHRQFWIAAAMRATLKNATIIGATSFTCNPLPDAATNPAEANIACEVGQTAGINFYNQVTLDFGLPTQETLHIANVVSNPTPYTAGYTSFTFTTVETAAFAHSIGAAVTDVMPAGATDPTRWDARSTLGTSTITTY